MASGILELQHTKNPKAKVIIFVHTPSFKAYQDAPERILDIERTCPKCGNLLSRNGSRLRQVFTGGTCTRISIFRLRCRPCHLSITLVPDFLVPYHRYIGRVIKDMVEQYLSTTLSYRALAFQNSGIELPPDQSLTDFLLLQPLFPSYQRIHAWIRRLASLAANYTQSFIAWLIRLKPESLLIDLLSTELPAFTLKAHSEKVRQQLQDAAWLLSILKNTPELAFTEGWLQKLNRIVLRIVGAIPWRAPPCKQGLPPSP